MMNGAVHELALNSFERDGYLVVRGLADVSTREAMRGAVLAALDPVRAPVEYEADVGYPGSPANRFVAGGQTPRRLLNAFSRDALFRAWGADMRVTEHLCALMDEPEIHLSQCHHNCVMTKHPGFSSKTLWHQDVRYWSFDQPSLVSVWLALDKERSNNGALRIIPGSHNLDLDRGQLDRGLFLRTDLKQNRALIEQAVVVELDPGDVLFFHCRVFHAASANETEQVKLSVVFTYHGEENRPIPGTRSDLYSSIKV
jgi:phytanoyl-CoA hydroxylase